jgi:type I restriction enzyme, S subunit
VKQLADTLPEKRARSEQGEVSTLLDLPTRWRFLRCKHLFEEIDTRSIAGDEPLLSVSKFYGVLPRAEVSDREARADTLVGYKLCKPDDIVINRMSAYEGALGVSPCHGIVSPDYSVFRPLDGVHARYFAHLFRTPLYCGEFLRRVRGIGGGSESNVRTPRLNPSDFGLVQATVPPLPEQRAIAAFLDRETARIDELTERNEVLLSRLREWRISKIHSATTKGIDPHQPMRDTNIPWLRGIPAHWQIMQIKRLSQVARGASPRPIEDPVYFDDNGQYAWVRISDVTASGKVLHSTTQRLSAYGHQFSVKIEPGQLFVSIAGSVGKPVISGIQCCIHDGFVYFPTLSGSPDYLYYLFAAGQLYRGLGKLGTQLNLNTDTIGSIVIPVPPPDEQRAIAACLDSILAESNEVIERVRRRLVLLAERRQALITGAVTGQIDVSQAVA